MIGKLVCWGKDRETAISRTIRALKEFEVSGLHTTIPADIAILSHHDFRAVEHSTKWVEESLDLTEITGTPFATNGNESSTEIRTADIEVNGKRFDVSISVPNISGQTRRSASSLGGSAGGGDGRISVPMQGTIVKIQTSIGAIVEAGDILVVLEAMKMENNITSDVNGTVVEISVSEGDAVGAGDVIIVIETGD